MKIAALQEQVISAAVAVETKAAGVELALRRDLNRKNLLPRLLRLRHCRNFAASWSAGYGGADAVGEGTNVRRCAEQSRAETHAARAAHATDRAEVLDRHAVAIAAAEQAKATLLQGRVKGFCSYGPGLREHCTLSSEIAIKASQWDEDRKYYNSADAISPKLDSLQVEYDKETAAPEVPDTPRR